MDDMIKLLDEFMYRCKCGDGLDDLCELCKRTRALLYEIGHE